MQEAHAQAAQRRYSSVAKTTPDEAQAADKHVPAGVRTRVAELEADFVAMRKELPDHVKKLTNGIECASARRARTLAAGMPPTLPAQLCLVP